MVLAIDNILHMSIVDILDILIIAVILFYVFKWIKGSSAVNIFVAIIALLVIQVIAIALEMKMLSSLLGTMIDIGAVGLIVIFQPEVRRFLIRIGRSNIATGGGFFGKFFKKSVSVSIEADDLDEICKACEEMSEQKTGALIVFPKIDPTKDIADTGDIVDAKISKRLIMNIFFKNSPLHDGAMIIANGRILAARCTLPITERNIPAKYGMRHKAAVGMSEHSDADVLVVSEETGGISLMRGGEIIKIDSIHKLKGLLTSSDDGHQTGE